MTLGHKTNPKNSQNVGNKYAPKKFLSLNIGLLATLISVAMIGAGTSLVWNGVKKFFSTLLPSPAKYIDNLVNSISASFKDLSEKAVKGIAPSSFQNSLTWAMPLVEDAFLDKYFKDAKKDFVEQFKNYLGVKQEPVVPKKIEERSLRNHTDMLSYKGKILLAHSLALLAAVPYRTAASLYLRMLMRVLNKATTGKDLFEAGFSFKKEVASTVVANTLYATVKKMPGNLAEFAYETCPQYTEAVGEQIITYAAQGAEYATQGMTFAWNKVAKTLNFSCSSLNISDDLIGIDSNNTLRNHNCVP